MKIDQFLKEYDVFDAGMECYHDDNKGKIEIVANLISDYNPLISEQFDEYQNFKITIAYENSKYDEEETKDISSGQLGNIICFKIIEGNDVELVASVTNYQTKENTVLAAKIKVTSISIESIQGSIA